MQIDLTPAEAEELLEALSKFCALDGYDLIGLDRDWRKSEPLILLFAKLMRVVHADDGVETPE